MKTDRGPTPFEPARESESLPKPHILKYGERMLSVDGEQVDECGNRDYPEHRGMFLWIPDQPEQFLEGAALALDEEVQGTRCEGMGSELLRGGIPSLDDAASRRAVVGYVYSWAFARGYDLSNPAAAQEALSCLPGSVYDRLVEEYRRSPDGRFGDALLVALEMEMKR